MPSSRPWAWACRWEGRAGLQLPQPCGRAADGAQPQVLKQEGPGRGAPGNAVYLLGFTQAGGAGPFLLGISAALPRCLFCLCWILQEEEAQTRLWVGTAQLVSPSFLSPLGVS